MKKFYTLLSAALLSVGLVSAATNAANLKTPRIHNIEKALETVKSTTDKAVKPADIESFTRAVKAPSLRLTDPNAPKPTGEFYMICQIDGEENSQTTPMNIEAGETSGTFIVKNFLYTLTGVESNDLTATISSQQYDGDTYYFLEFELTPVLFNYNNADYTLYLYAQNTQDGQYYLYPNDAITFLILRSGDNYILANAYESETVPAGVFVGYDSGNGRYSGFSAYTSTAYPQNGTLTNEAEYIDDENSTPTEYGLYALATEDSYLLVLNLAGFAEIASFNINAASQTVSTNDCVLFSIPAGYYEQMPNGADFYATNAENGYTLTATVTTDNNGCSVLDFGNWYVINTNFGWYSKFEGSKATLSFNIFENAGINNVIADTDLNAPVEYYNLQGVRVVNPDAGQLVIKRQGKTVTKEIVR